MLIYTGSKEAGWHRKEDLIEGTFKGVPHYRYVPEDSTADSPDINVLCGMTCRRTHHACYLIMSLKVSEIELNTDLACKKGAFQLA